MMWGAFAQVFNQRLNDEWHLETTIGTSHPGSSSYALDTPLGVEYHAASGHLFVADSGNQRVQVLVRCYLLFTNNQNDAFFVHSF